MAGKPRFEAEGTFAGGRSFLQGPLPDDPVVCSVQIPPVVVPQSPHRLVDGGGDNHLRDAANLGVVHLHPGGQRPPLPPLSARRGLTPVWGLLPSTGPAST